MGNGNIMDTTRGARNLPFYLCICLVGLVIYSPILNADFSSQELTFLAWTKYAEPVDYLYRFIPFKGEMAYRPLYNVICALSYMLWGDNAPLFHRQILAVHLLNACLLFLIVFRLGGSRIVSFLTALFFVSTPLSAETVSLISWGIDDVYSMLFLLLALLCFIKIDDRPDSRGKWIISSLSLGLLALLTRESAITLPLAVLLCDCIVIRTRKGKALIPYLRERWMLYGYYFLLVLSFFIIRTWLLGGLMGYGAGGKTYVPPIMDIARDAFLRLPGILILPLKHSTIQKIFPSYTVRFMTQPYFIIVAFLVLCSLTVSIRRIQWPLVIFGMAWCFAGILAHWQVLHSIGLLSQDLEYSHYLYQSTAGFYLAISSLFICGRPGWKRTIGLSILIAFIFAYGLVSRSYCATYRYAFHVRHVIQNQFNDMDLPLTQGSRVFFIDVPTHIEGALVLWGGTTITVWNDPEPSTKPIFEMGLFHYSIEPTIRERYPYRIFLLNRDVEIESRRNEYEAAPRFSLDYLRSLDIGKNAFFLKWNMKDERLDNITQEVRAVACAHEQKEQITWPPAQYEKAFLWGPFGNSKWDPENGGGESRLLVDSSGAGIQIDNLKIPPDEYKNLVLEMKGTETLTLNMTLQYKTVEDSLFDDNKRVSLDVPITGTYGNYSIPLTRRIYDLLDGDITGLRLLFSGKCPVELLIKDIRVE